MSRSTADAAGGHEHPAPTRRGVHDKLTGLAARHQPVAAYTTD